MKINELLNKLRNVKGSGFKYLASCPAHDDKNPSLSINSKGDRILLYCHAGCSFSEICDALQIKPSDLNGKSEKPTRSKQTVNYNYRDENGELLFQSVRSSDKSFRLRIPNENGGWNYSLNGTRLIPYRLPEVISAEEDSTVFIVEGEKDVDNLFAIGLIATTNPMGAMKWRDEFSEHFRGRKCVIIPDNDVVGRKHAHKVAQSLFETAKSVQILELPEMNEKEDVSDFLQHGGTKSDLLELVKTASDFEPSQPRASELSIVFHSFSELMNMRSKKLEEIIFGLHRGEFGIVNAVTNVGKTTLLRNIMISLATGKPYPPLCKPQNPKRVVFVDFEDTLNALKHDLRAMTSEFSKEEIDLLNNNCHLLCGGMLSDGSSLDLSEKVHQDLLIESQRDFKPDLIIIDTLSTAFNINDENNNAEVRKMVTKPLQRIARCLNTAVAVAHHVGKSYSEQGNTREKSHRGRGASTLADMSRLILDLAREKKKDRVVLSCAKVKGREFDPTLLTLDPNTRWFNEIETKSEKTKYEKFLDYFEDEAIYETQEIVSHCETTLNLGERTIKQYLSDALKNQDLIQPKHGRYKKHKQIKEHSIGNESQTGLF